MDLSKATQLVEVEIGSCHNRSVTGLSSPGKRFPQINSKNLEQVSIHLPFSSSMMRPDHEIRNETSPWSNIDTALTKLFSDQEIIRGLKVIWWGGADQEKVDDKVMDGFLEWLLPKMVKRVKIKVDKRK